LLKPNRQRQAWLVLIPLAAITLVFGLLARAVPYVLGQEPLGILPSALCLGLSVLWLFSYRMATLWRLGSFFVALLMLWLVGILIMVSGGAAGGMAVVGVIAFGAVALAVLVGLTGAGVCCRKKYSAVRFTVWLFPCMILAAFLVGAPFAAISLAGLLFSGGLQMAASVLMGVGVACAVSGIVLALVATLFLLVAFLSPFYRARFYSVFRLPGMTVQKEGGSISGGAKSLKPPEMNP
jgi:hypothetical protein